MMTRALLFALLLSSPLSAARLFVHPGGTIYAYDVDARRGLRSAMLQNVALLNDSSESLKVESLIVEMRDHDRLRGSLVFGSAELEQSAKKFTAMKAGGLLTLYDFAFQLERYLPRDVRIAESSDVPSNGVLLLNGVSLLLPKGVDRLTLRAQTSAGVVTLELPIAGYRQKNEYRFPLNGSWLVVVGPGFAEPHRWVLNEEFAFDVVRVGASGSTCAKRCARLSDYYAYGADVVAVAAGEVVSVEKDQGESSSRLRQPGEAAEAFMQRTMVEQSKLLQSGHAAGNVIVLRHDGGEYSHYAHLATGSIRVKVGDRVVAGQKIAKLGHSGNSTEPHLHFGIADGPDPLYSRSLPVRFSGITTPDGRQPPLLLQSGWLVTSSNR